MKLPLSTSRIFLAWLAAGLIATPSLRASQGDEELDVEQEECRGILLPGWEEGACRESFDIRIWPTAVVTWLEQENLRDLIADPETPELERKALQRILALQTAWGGNRKKS